ncbi:MAG: hypothetical protein R6V45_02800 [Oceanipulchritudo sp.]
MKDLIDANRSLLEQADALLADLDEEAYTRPCEACFRSTPGGHLRHILEHYGSFLDGLADRRIDYDRRDRGSPVEFSVEAARAEVERLLLDLEGASRIDPGERLAILLDDGGSARESSSNPERELQFLLSHSVHHFALMRTMLYLDGHRAFPEGFGIAPSTLRYLAAAG